MTRNSQKIFGVIVGFIVLAVAVFVVTQAPSFVNKAFAQTNAPQNGDAGGFVPCGNTADNPCQVGHLFSTFVVIINYLIAMAGFIAVIAIVYAGFMMVYSQGQEQLKAAKGRLSGAVIGLVLVAGAFILINALFSGSLSVGVREGTGILSNPLEYIQNGPSGAKSSTPSTPSTPTTTNTNKPITNTAPKNTPIPKPGK